MTRRPSFPARIDFSHGQPTGRTVRPAAVAGSKAGATHRRGGRAPRWARQGLGMDSVAVRASMVQKLAAQGVADKWVLQAMGAVERHRFVDPALVNQAYEDTSLPIGLGQTISKPNVVARMMELLRHGQPGQTGPGAGDRHRLRLPGGRAEPPGHRGVQHRTAARPA
jgi:protein-L-isoaspartate(D-aspartate) O-methyltransferase